MTLETALTLIDEDEEGYTTEELPDPQQLLLDYIPTARERNLQRGLFAGVALKAYAGRTGIGGEGLSMAIGDLLGDLRHLCDATHLDFAALVDGGGRHYQDEIGGEG